MANIIQINGYTISSSNGGGGGSNFPYTGSAIISGSLIVTGSTTSTLGFTGSLFGTSSNALTASYFKNNTSVIERDGSGVLNITSSRIDINGPTALTLRSTNGIDLTGTTTITGNLLPGSPITNNTSSWNLGSPSAAWKDLYVSNGSINFISGSVSSSIGFNNGAITFNNATVNLPAGSTVPTASFAFSSSTAQTSSKILGGTTNYIPLWSDNISLGSSVLYQSSTNIGLGTTSPNTILHISASSAQPLLNIENSISNGYSNMRFTGTGRKYVIGVGNASETTFGIANDFFLYDDTTGAIRMVVDSNGQIGIGTTSPAYTLDVNGSGDFSNGLTVTGSTNINGTLTATTIHTSSLYTFVGELASDITNASATVPSDVTGLTFNYAANSAYNITVHALVSSSANTTGYGFSLSASSAVTNVWSQQFHQSSTAGALAGGSSLGNNTILTVSATTGVGASGVPVTFFGYLRTGANSGTCTLRFRAEVAATTTIKAGSIMFVQKII